MRGCARGTIDAPTHRVQVPPGRRPSPAALSATRMSAAREAHVLARHVRKLPAAILASLTLMIVHGSSAGSPAPPCPGGRYIVQDGTLIGGDTDWILIEDGKVSIGGACLPAQATRLAGSPHGTKLKVRW